MEHIGEFVYNHIQTSHRLDEATMHGLLTALKHHSMQEFGVDLDFQCSLG